MKPGMRDRSDLPHHVRDAAGDFRDRVRARFGARLELIRLFGSYARGDHGADSDVDVLVVIQELIDRERREVFEIAFDVHLERGIDVSPLALSSAEWSDRRDRELLLVSDIDREGMNL
jgi:uncharacterized protein